MKTKPWVDTIPQEDIASFRADVDPNQRPLTAGDRPAVVVVDMTRAFVLDEYRTGWSATGIPAVKANARLLQAARAARIPVFFTKAYSDPLYQPTPAESGRWKENEVIGNVGDSGSCPQLPGDRIVDELKPLPGEIVIYKGSRPSGFAGTPLAAFLIHGGCDTVIVTGMTTSGCVRATALDAFTLNFNVIIPFECSADRSQISHKVTLFDVHMKYADVVSLDETIAYLADLRSVR